jgi:hypothetical protein
MNNIPGEEKRWKKFKELIRNTIKSSKQLSDLINKYLSEKDVQRKRIISRKIDSQFRKGH